MADSSDDDFQSDTLQNAKVGRRTYLVTYSQANLEKFPTRRLFGEMVEKYFNKSFREGKSKVRTEYFAVCREKHANGGDHYHMSLKLSV